MVCDKGEVKGEEGRLSKGRLDLRVGVVVVGESEGEGTVSLMG